MPTPDASTGRMLFRRENTRPPFVQRKDGDGQVCLYFPMLAYRLQAVILGDLDGRASAYATVRFDLDPHPADIFRLPS